MYLILIRFAYVLCNICNTLQCVMHHLRKCCASPLHGSHRRYTTVWRSRVWSCIFGTHESMSEMHPPLLTISFPR